MQDRDLEEVDIQRWLSVLGRGWIVLALGIVAGGLLGLFAATRAPDVFEASATVLIVPPPDQAGIFAVPALRTLLTNQSSATDVVRELGLDRPPYQMTPASLLTHLVVEDVPNTFLLRLKARLADPALAAKAANGMAERAAALAKGLWTDAIGARRTLLERQTEDARVRLADAERRRAEYRQRSGIEELRDEADRMAARRADADHVALEAAEEAARLKVLESELARRGPQKARDGSGERSVPSQVTVPPDSIRQSSERESAGPASDRIDDRVLESRTQVAALEELQKRLASPTRGQDRARLSQLYAKEAELNRMESEADLLRRLYTDAASRAALTKVDAELAQPPLRLLDPAVVPDQPLRQPRVRTIGIGVLAGLVLGGCVVLLGEWRVHGRR